MTLAGDRRSALVAGLALLLMSVLAAVAILGVIDPIVASDDIAGEIRDAGARFDLAVAGLVVIALLDLVIAWALWRLFTPVDRRLAGLAGAARAAYALVYLVAIGFLATAEPANVERYQELWDLGLLVFGVHLVLVGVLCWRSGFVPRVIGCPRRARRCGLRGRLDRRAGVGVVRRRARCVPVRRRGRADGVADLVGPARWRGFEARAWRPSHLNHRKARWLRCEERQRRGSGLAALTPQPPKGSVVEVRGAPATSLETTTRQPVAPNCSTRIVAASTPHSSSNPSAYSANRDDPQT